MISVSCGAEEARESDDGAGETAIFSVEEAKENDGVVVAEKATVDGGAERANACVGAKADDDRKRRVDHTNHVYHIGAEMATYHGRKDVAGNR